MQDQTPFFTTIGTSRATNSGLELEFEGDVPEFGSSSWPCWRTMRFYYLFFLNSSSFMNKQAALVVLANAPLSCIVCW